MRWASPNTVGSPSDTSTESSSSRWSTSGSKRRTTSLTQRAAELASTARPGDCDRNELLSFLALEGAPPDVKLKMLASTSRAERLAAARGELERQKAELAAKASLKSLNLSWGDDDEGS